MIITRWQQQRDFTVYYVVVRCPFYRVAGYMNRRWTLARFPQNIGHVLMSILQIFFVTTFRISTLLNRVCLVESSLLLGQIELGVFIRWSVDQTYLHVLTEYMPSRSPGFQALERQQLFSLWVLGLVFGEKSWALNPVWIIITGFSEVLSRVNEFKTYF